MVNLASTAALVGLFEKRSVSALGMAIASHLALRLRRRAQRALIQARQFGQYTLEERIGGGGMGETCFLAVAAGGLALICLRCTRWQLPAAAFATVGLLSAVWPIRVDVGASRVWFPILAQLVPQSPAPPDSEKKPLEKSAYFAFVDRDYIFTIEGVKPGVFLLNFVSMADQDITLMAKYVRLTLENRKERGFHNSHRPYQLAFITLFGDEP
jgi:hypothetical protein